MSIQTRKVEVYIKSKGFQKKSITEYICPYCWYETRYLGTMRKHMAKQHNQNLNNFI